MDALNNRHYKYITASTSGITILQMIDRTFNDNPLPLLHKLVKAYEDEILNSTVSNKTLEVLYEVLCFEYQLKFKSEKNARCEDDSTGFSIAKILPYLMKNEESSVSKEISILFDIIILQITLHLNAEQLESLVEYCCKIDGKIVNIDYIPSIINCITEALYLRFRLDNREELKRLTVTEISTLLLNLTTTSIFRVENPQWKLFVSTLGKMIVIFDPNLIVPHLWDTIFEANYNDYEKKIIMLSCIIDDILKLSNDEIIKSNIAYCIKDIFWQFIAYGLTSNVAQQRKHALYIMRRALEFIEKHKSKISPGNNIVPFIQCQRDDQVPLLEQAMIKFFLILESLEEAQGHLIIPVLVHVRELMQINSDHQTCGNCFDRIWLYCIFQRILQHKKNAVMKSGLLDLMKMNPMTFDNSLLSLLVYSLNNMSLYDNKSTDMLPEISRELAGLFITSEYYQVALMNDFIRAASRITWAPIPLFYVFESLRIACAQLKNVGTNIWTENELEAIITIMEKNLNQLKSPLRVEIRINICKMFNCCAKQSLDWNVLAKTFSIFPSTKMIDRGSESWNLILQYLNCIEAKDAEKFISESCYKLCINQGDEEINLKSLAIMMVFLYDGKKIFVSKSCAVQKSLTDVFNLIYNADIRPYADAILSLRAINLMRYLVDILSIPYETATTEKDDCFNQLIFPYLDSAQRYMVINLNQSLFPKTYEEATIYVESFFTITAFNRFIYESVNFLNDMKIFHEILIRKLKKLNGVVNLRFWYNLKLLLICSKYIMKKYTEGRMFEDFLFKMCQQQLRIDDKSDVANGGKIISECYQTVTRILKLYFLHFTGHTHINFEVWLSTFKDMIDIGKEYVIPSIAEIVKFEFMSRDEKFSCNIQIYQSIIDVAWQNIWDAKKSTLFWSSIDQLMDLMLDTNVLNHRDLIPTVTMYIEKIVKESENISYLKNIFAQRLRELRVSDFLLLHDKMIKCFLYVDASRIDKRIETQTYDYLLKQGEIVDFYQYTVTTFQKHGIHVDVLFRAQCVLTLLRVMSSSERVYHTMSNMLFFCAILLELKDKRYFANSTIHRIKHRTMQLLLMIQPQLNEEVSSVLYNKISDLLITDNNQPTVRVMQEWLLIRISLKYPSLLDKIWGLLEKSKIERPSSITSVAIIIYHVAQKLLLDKKVQYIRLAIRKLLSSCFSQSFVIRLNCQVILSKLFDMIQPLWSLSLDYSMIKDAITESLRHGNLQRNSTKLLENFYLNVFDPLEDYDLQTIFYDLPRLLNMSSDELISADIFSEMLCEYQLCCSYFPQAPDIHIMNKRGLLERLISSKVHNLNDEILEQLEDVENLTCDIQKKIIPWKEIVSSNDGSTTLKLSKLTNDVGLIVVASLIDSIPNLGGLSRTSEIFSARELVIANMNYTELKEFQSVSVSSEKWITLTEVKPYKLRNYLLEKKSMGWTLVGAEQTANSISLLDVKFDKKTILLLGNEKKGIPANLIPLMDVCVEIPQTGVIRSLNVHVTAAICLWHYAQQYIFVDV